MSKFAGISAQKRKPKKRIHPIRSSKITTQRILKASDAKLLATARYLRHQHDRAQSDDERQACATLIAFINQTIQERRR